MGVSYGQSINGNQTLIWGLDAADPNSYPGSGNIWYDLSYQKNNGERSVGNQVPEFIESGAKSCFRFGSTGQYFRTERNVPLNGSGWPITVMVGFNQTESRNRVSFLSYGDQETEQVLGTDHWAPGGRKASVAHNLNTPLIAAWTMDSWFNHQTGTRIYISGEEVPTVSFSVDNESRSPSSFGLYMGNWDIDRADMDFQGDMYFMYVWSGEMTPIQVNGYYHYFNKRFKE